MENLFTLKVMVVYIFNLGEGWFSSLLAASPLHTAKWTSSSQEQKGLPGQTKSQTEA